MPPKQKRPPRPSAKPPDDGDPSQLIDLDEDCELEDSKEIGDIEFLNVEGDGVLDVVYEALWTRWNEEGTAPVTPGGPGIDVAVPDTVSFKYNKAVAWYYIKFARAPGGKTAARLHKKRENALRNHTILAAFLKTTRNNISEIVAYFIAQPTQTGMPGKEKPPPPAMGYSELTRAKQSEANLAGELRRATRKYGETKNLTKITYFNREDLEHFLLVEEPKPDGILQVFLDPKPTTAGKYHNSLVRCTWSPSVCLVERRSSIHELNVSNDMKEKTSMYQRAETFEGTFRNSEESPLTSITLLDDIQRKCIAIVNHYISLSKKIGVKRMVLNFKFDKYGRLFFCWCESLRLNRDPSIRLAPPILVGSEDGKLSPFNLQTKLTLPSMRLQGEVYGTCRICDQSFSQSDLNGVRYRTLLAAQGIHTYNEPEPGQTFVDKNFKLRNLKKKEVAMLTWDPEAEKRKRQKACRKQPWRHPPKTRQVEEQKEERGPAVIDEGIFTSPPKASKGLLGQLDEKTALNDPVEALLELDTRLKEMQKLRELDADQFTPGLVGTEIPRFIAKLHPYMSPYDYSKLRHREDFLSIQVQMCPTCFLRNTQSVDAGLVADGDSEKGLASPSAAHASLRCRPGHGLSSQLLTLEPLADPSKSPSSTPLASGDRPSPPQRRVNAHFSVMSRKSEPEDSETDDITDSELGSQLVPVGTMDELAWANCESSLSSPKAIVTPSCDLGSMDLPGNVEAPTSPSKRLPSVRSSSLPPVRIASPSPSSTTPLTPSHRDGSLASSMGEAPGSAPTQPGRSAVEDRVHLYRKLLSTSSPEPGRSLLSKVGLGQSEKSVKERRKERSEAVKYSAQVYHEVRNRELAALGKPGFQASTYNRSDLRRRLGVRPLKAANLATPTSPDQKGPEDSPGQSEGESSPAFALRTIIE